MSSPPSRLVLTHIELENFKSYYGRRVIGPFHKRFSSIVGPNGSGKSNVIDALLFVFGRRAKQIRLKKISELVHNSENHANCKQARVNVHFQEIIDDEDDADNFTVVPDSQLVISRVATKQSTSAYLINGQQSSLTRVHEVLLGKGIDLNNNRFLILQGEVESIAMMKPKASGASDDGLLEYLEDIIGSKQYVAQIEACAEQVDTLNSEVQERLNRVKVVERDRDKLADAKNEAQDFIRAQLQLYKLHAVHKQLLLNQYDNTRHAVEQRLSDIQRSIADKEGKESEIKSEMQDVEEQYQLIKKERNKIEKEVQSHEKQFHEFEQNDVTIQERLKFLKKETSKLKKNRSTLEKQTEECSATIETNTALIPQLEDETQTLQSQLEAESEKQQQMMAQLAEKTQPIKEAMEEKQTQLMPLKDREIGIKQQVDAIANDIEAIEQKCRESEQRKQELLQRIADIDENIVREQAAHATHAQALQTLTQTCTQQESSCAALQTAQQQLEHELNALHAQCNECRTALEQQQNANNAAGGGGGGDSMAQRLVQQLLAAQQRGDLSGILGRLGDLGRIDAQYDIAASTAATGQLNYIVVEKTHHAQRAIEYLKRHQLGRATMLILEKQKHLLSKATRTIATPQNVHRLYDLVTLAEDKFAVAFYFAFGDTLVANNLNQANSLAFAGGRRWRVVTLQGQLIETSGAMSGGGNKVYKGLMSDRIEQAQQQQQQQQHNREEEDAKYEALKQRLRAVQEQIQRVGAQLERTRGDEQSARSKLHSDTKSLKACKLSVRKSQMQIDGLQQRKSTLEQQIPELDANEARDRSAAEQGSRRQELEHAKEAKSEEYRAAQHDCELLEDEIRELEEQILEAGGTSLRQQKALVDRLKKKLSDTSKKSTKLAVEIKTCEKKLKTSRKKLATLEKSVSEMQTEYEECKVKKSELEDAAGALLNVLEEKKTALSEKEGAYKKLQTVVDKNNTRLSKLAKEIFDAKEEEQKKSDEQKSIVHRSKKTKAEWKQLQTKYVQNKDQFLHEIDDEDEEDEEEEEDDENKVPEDVENKNQKMAQDENDDGNEANVDDDDDDDDDDARPLVF